MSDAIKQRLHDLMLDLEGDIEQARLAGRNARESEDRYFCQIAQENAERMLERCRKVLEG